MSPAAHSYADTPVLTAQRGGLAPTAPAKMSLYDLMSRFWQLNDEHAFTAKETRLYFYLLNEFNSARWAARIYRKTTQICADLSADKNTVNGARAALEARGLVFYKAGNPGASAVWSLTEEVKNSPMQPVERLEVEVKNSPQVPTIRPERLEVEVNFSPTYKEEEKTTTQEEEKTPTVAADAAAPAQKKIGASEISSTDLPADEAQLVPPVARPPQKKPAKPKPAGEPEHFAAFWDAYPRHDDRQKAVAAFARLSPEDQAAAPDRAARWIARRTDWISADGTDYRPYAATWLNKRRWTELAEPLPTPSPTAAPTHATQHATSHSPRPVGGQKPTGDAAHVVAESLMRRRFAKPLGD